MKLYRLTIDIPMNFAYVEYPGFDFDTDFKLIMGEKIDKINSSEMIVKNKTKFYPSIMGNGNSPFFVDNAFKKFLIEKAVNKNLNFIYFPINRKEYFLLNIVGLSDYMNYEKSVYTEFEINGLRSPFNFISLRSINTYKNGCF